MWLAILTTIVAYFSFQVLEGLKSSPPAIAIVAIAALIAPRFANWLIRPFKDSFLRRLLWGFATAAVLLLVVRVAMALVILGFLRLDGVGAEKAGIAAFHGAAQLTLAIAMPVWILYAIWGWLRRRSLARDAALPFWRRLLPFTFVAAIMIFLGSEGAYFDALNGTTFGVPHIRK